MYDLLFMNNMHGLEHLIIATALQGLYGRGRRKGHDLLPVVSNPDQVEWLLLLLLKKSCEIFG